MITGRCPGRGSAGTVLAVVLATLAGVSAHAIGQARQPSATSPPAGDVLEFHRVHVPSARVGEVPLGAERLVPMPLEDFEAAVSRLRPPNAADARPLPLAAAARYEAAIDDGGMLSGQVTIEVATEVATVSPAVPLGALPVRVAGSRSEADAEGFVFSTPGGGYALRIPAAGSSTCDFGCPALVEGDVRYRLPLVPALTSSIRLRLPVELRPVLDGSIARHAVVRPPDGKLSDWRIELGPQVAGEIAIVPRERVAPPLAVWSEHTIRPGETQVVAVIEPASGWQSGGLVLEREAGLTLTAVRVEGFDELVQWHAGADRDVEIVVPAWLEGQRAPLVLRGIAPASEGPRLLPLVRQPAKRWSGGGISVRVDPVLVVDAVDVTECRVVPAQAAARWPRPSGSPVGGMAESEEDETAMVGRRPALFHFEQQAAAAAVEIGVVPRLPSFDVARVTTVEISPGAVLGRVACDVRVVDGAAFDIEGRVAPGWIIDAVDAVDWTTGGGEGGRGVPRGDTVPEWRVIRGREGAVLRIGLAVGAAPGRSLGLMIAGHRPGLPAGAPFNTGDMDMVQFAGESSDSAVIDFKTSAESVVEIVGEPAAWFPLEGRLAALAEERTPRGRIRGGAQAPARQGRIVQRRPPLDAAVEVRLDVREEMLLESFVFDCRAEAGGIDALVVHFSEPMDDSLEWSLVAPAGAALKPRRLEAADGRPSGMLSGNAAGGLRSSAGGGGRGAPIAESWLVELNPRVPGPARLRAVRTIPFSGPVAVPLAWVESARVSRGTVVVSAAGGPRPQIVNRRLRELPADAAGGPPASRVLEFSYGPPVADDDRLPAAELEPAREADARSWAWIEQVRCWCHESGDIECESVFEIENHGREAVVLSVPSGRRLEGVQVDGVAVPIDAVGTRGGTLRIPLPSARRRIELFVRTVAESSGAGFWRVNPLGCALDMPLLDRALTLLLPPGLEAATSAAGFRRTLPERHGWPERLFASRLRDERVAAADGTGLSRAGDSVAIDGFRACRYDVTNDRLVGAGIAIYSRRMLASLGLLLAVVSGCLAAAVSATRSGAAAGICLALALTALWVPPPLIPVARMAWWAALAGAVGTWAIRRPQVAAAAALWIPLWLAPGLVAAQDAAVGTLPAGESLRVFVTDDQGSAMALVPEPLYRLLADASTPDAAVRVVSCRVLVPDSAPAAPWRIVVDLDADAGGTLVLPQPPTGARWISSGVEGRLPAGVLVKPEGRRVRVVFADSGRFTVPLEQVPAVLNEGGIETFSAAVPTAPVATLTVFDGRQAPVRVPPGTLICEQSAAAAPYLAAVPVAIGLGEAVFDIAGAERVRVVRPSDGRDRLTLVPRLSESVNELLWDMEGCRVEARFTMDSGAELLRSFMLRVDERLTELAVAAGGRPMRLQRVDPGRWLCEFTAPVRGRAEVRLEARMPLVDPVGVFEVPGLWPQVAGADRPEVKLSAIPELEAMLDVPATAGAVAEAQLRPGERVTIRRRRQLARGVQNLVVEYAPDRIGLRLRGQVEAVTTAMMRMTFAVPPESVIDRIELADEEPAVDGLRGRPLDLVWTRSAPDRVMAIVQQPTVGRFRFAVDARVPGPPAGRGPLPLLRAGVGGGTPLLVTWQVESPGRLAVDGMEEMAGDGRTANGTLELFEDETPPEYRYDAGAEDPLPGEEPGEGETVHEDPDATATLTASANQVEAAEVRMVLDARGRATGLARFDVVTAEPQLRIMLPPGMRLFGVLVDGVETLAVPQETGTWAVRLFDVGWPRSILVLFAGDLGSSVTAGRPVRLEPPRLSGVAMRDVTWLVSPPTGTTLRVADSVRRASPNRENGRLDELFARLQERPAADDPGRLAALAALRREGRSLPVEEAWQRAVARPERTGASSLALSIPASEPLTFRIARSVDPTDASRALATAGMALAFGVLWSLRRRHIPVAWWAGRIPMLPALCMLAGIVWVTLLVPALPGWSLAAGGAAGALAPWWRGALGGGRRSSVGAVGSDSTATAVISN